MMLLLLVVFLSCVSAYFLNVKALFSAFTHAHNGHSLCNVYDVMVTIL